MKITLIYQHSLLSTSTSSLLSMPLSTNAMPTNSIPLSSKSSLSHLKTPLVLKIKSSPKKTLLNELRVNYISLKKKLQISPW